MASNFQGIPFSEAKCDFCEERRAFLYCKPDSARLCLPCDHHVHAANPLSLKHPRSPLCECCGQRPATLQCEEEVKFLCANCGQSAHTGEGHTLVKASTFRGCLTPAQLASAWKCHAPNLLPDNFLLSRGAALDKLCWNSDGSLGSILASPWTSSFDAFILSDSNSDYAGISSSSDYLLEGYVNNKVFAEQLEQLQRRQLQGNDYIAGMLQEPFQGSWVPSSELSELPFRNIKAQNIDEQNQQEVPVQPDCHFTSSHLLAEPFINNGFHNGTFERKALEAKGALASNILKHADVAFMHPLIENSNQHTRTVPPSAGSILAKDRADLFKNQEESLSPVQTKSSLGDTLWPHPSQNAGGKEGRMHDCPNVSRSSPKEANECVSFNEETLTSCMKSPCPDVQNQAEHEKNSGLLNKESAIADSFVAPTKFDSAAVAEARGSAMLRYKAKRKTRNFEKLVRYESRKARAETRLRVRGRFVKANGFNSEFVVADEIG